MPRVFARQRNNLRWLHAGVIKSAKGHIKNVWYAFMRSHDGAIRYKIVYAKDKQGTRLGNLGVGLGKRYIITWDKHHREKWSHLQTARGTWIYKCATAGRRVQRDTLLDTYLNDRFVDPHPNGVDMKVLGPPMNVIHWTNDKTGAAEPDIEEEEQHQPSAECFPGTKIPFSEAGIKIDYWKEESADPLKVIDDFLTGKMANDRTFARYAQEKNQKIEAAFFHMGWRVNRAALAQANHDMYESRASVAFESDIWRDNPPVRYHRYKGEEVERMLNNAERASEANENLDGDDDSDIDIDVEDIIDLEDDDEEEEEIDSASESSVSTVRTVPLKPLNDAHVIPSIEVNGHEDDGSLFVPQDTPLAMPGPSFRTLDDILTEEITKGFAGANSSSSTSETPRPPVISRLSSDDETFLPDHSKKKGKALASRKRRELGQSKGKARTVASERLSQPNSLSSRFNKLMNTSGKDPLSPHAPTADPSPPAPQFITQTLNNTDKSLEPPGAPIEPKIEIGEEDSKSGIIVSSSVSSRGHANKGTANDPISLLEDDSDDVKTVSVRDDPNAEVQWIGSRSVKLESSADGSVRVRTPGRSIFG